ncbi:MAG: hypothetical protein AB7F35_20240 [Acetobacteraceae bacterium]
MPLPLLRHPDHIRDALSDRFANIETVFGLKLTVLGAFGIPLTLWAGQAQGFTFLIYGAFGMTLTYGLWLLFADQVKRADKRQRRIEARRDRQYRASRRKAAAHLERPS